MKKQKILITGGAGYIGSVLTPLLLENDYDVTVVDNLIYNQTSLLNCFWNKNFKFIKGDVNDPSLMKPLISSSDVIIALAAIVGAPACNSSPSVAKIVNYDAIELILKNISPNQMLLFPNTNSGYGIGNDNSFCDENSSLNPVSLYGKLKVDIEKKILDYPNTISFRLATVFGISPRMRLDLLVNDFTFRACHDKFIILFEEHFKRNYIHIKDVSKAFLFGITNFDKMKGQAYNVGLSTANISKLELCKKIKDYVSDFYIHCASIGEDIDKRNYIVSNKKLESLGWSPSYSLDDGIKEIIDAYPFLKFNNYKNI